MADHFPEAAIEIGLACSACGVRFNGESYRIGTHGERLCKGCQWTFPADISRKGVVKRHIYRYNGSDATKTPNPERHPDRPGAPNAARGHGGGSAVGLGVSDLRAEAPEGVGHD